jgi:predicted cobalt transporter CbtA
MRARVDLATFNAVVNDFRALGLVLMLIPPIVVKPQTEEQQKARPEIKEKKYIYVQTDHREES